MVEVVRTRTVQCLEERLHHTVDILLCNPPYVATQTEETGSKGLAAAWAGGEEGMDVTRQVIDSLEELLSPSGVAYIVLEQCNQPASVRQYVGTLGFTCTTVIERRAGREHLSVIKISR